MSAIVPWTSPGGTPCCCTPPLPTCPNLGDGPNSEYITATRFAIDADTYANLYAGGTMQLSISGSVTATAVSNFLNDEGGPAWSCSADGGGVGNLEFICPANVCRTSNLSKSNLNTNGIYNHYLEGNPDLNTFAVFFDIRGSVSVFQNCGFGREAGAVARQIIYNNGEPPPFTAGPNLAARSSSSIQVNLGNGIIFDVPAYSEQFTTALFFSYYVALAGSSVVSADWTPNAP